MVRKCTFVVVFILLYAFYPIRLTWAAYNGPVVIYSAETSNYKVEGRVVFGLTYFVRSDGTYVERESEHINIYGPAGLLRQISISGGAGTDARFNLYDQYIYAEGSGPKKNNIYIYDYSGNLVSTISSYKGNLVTALPNGDFITNIWKTDNYYKYSLTGQLLKTYTSRPLEIGVGKSQALGGGKYKTTVVYDDRTYSFDMDWDYVKSVKIFRDTSKKDVHLVTAGSVYKYNPCGKLIGEFKKPSDVTFMSEYVEGKEQEIIEHDLYGEPQMDIYGNVYVWKKTPYKYSILKWTWVDDPNAPSGPDAPSGLKVDVSTSGLYLSWTASPQDPGCVTGYEISRATSAGGSGTTVGTTTPGKVTFNDSTAASGTTYYYKVRAVSGSEYSPFTSEVSGRRP